MDQVRDLADYRLLEGCIYCGSHADATREHTPSRVFLDSPYPENLPIVVACRECNNGFSQDEEYLACLVEAAIAGSTDPDHIRRPSIASILRRAPALRARLEAAKSITADGVVFSGDGARIRSVIAKLARGHAAYELSLAIRHEVTSIQCWLLSSMSDAERDAYDAPHLVELLGEAGSRGSQRLIVLQLTLADSAGQRIARNLLLNDWIEVQQGNYRYLAIDDVSGVVVRIVFAEFLACEVFWSRSCE